MFNILQRENWKGAGGMRLLSGEMRVVTDRQPRSSGLPVWVSFTLRARMTGLGCRGGGVFM